MYYVLTNLEPGQSLSDPSVFWVIGQCSARTLHVGLSLHLSFYNGYFNRAPLKRAIFLESTRLVDDLIPALLASGLAVNLQYGIYRNYDEEGYALGPLLPKEDRLWQEEELVEHLAHWSQPIEQVDDLRFLFDGIGQ